MALVNPPSNKTARGQIVSASTQFTRYELLKQKYALHFAVVFGAIGLLLALLAFAASNK